MLDTSGSISDDLLKGFVTSTNKKGIQTDFEVAGSSFSKQSGITKIVFTDGILGRNLSTEAREIVFGNRMNFT